MNRLSETARSRDYFWMVKEAVQRRSALIEALKPSCDGLEARILMIARVRGLSMAEVSEELATVRGAA